MKNERYKIDFSNEAEADFDNSYEYYAIESQKVADNFYRQVNQSLKTISDNPQGFQRVFKNIRRYVIKKFPFVIYYRVENTTIQIIAVFHTSRNPEIWKQRIDNNDE